MVSIGNCLTSFFAGFVIFGIIGFMAHELGLPVDKVAVQGMEQITFSKAFSQLSLRIAYPRGILGKESSIIKPDCLCLKYNALHTLNGFGGRK